MAVKHLCHNCGNELTPPRTKWCSDRCRMRFKRQANGSSPQVIENEPQKIAGAVLEMEDEVNVFDVDVEETIIEEAVIESVVVAEVSDDVVDQNKMVPAETYNAVVVKNRELAVHVDLLVEERDKLSIQLGATQDRLISAERDSAANSARLERLPRLESDLMSERSARREAERSVSAADAKLDQMIRIEADLANERVAHADTKRKLLDTSSTAAAPAAPEEAAESERKTFGFSSPSPVSAGENAKGGMRIAPTYRQSQLSNFVILLLLFVIIILAALVFRFIINV